MNTITFTATITVRDDCEDMTEKELLTFAKYYLEAGSVVEVNSISVQGIEL